MCWEWGFYNFHHDAYLCRHVVAGRVISKTRSEDDVLFIESCQLSIVSIYGTGMKVSYFDHNKG